jgi:hypothetical protein
MILNATSYNKYKPPPTISLNTTNKCIILGVAVVRHLKLQGFDTVSFSKIKGKWYLHKAIDGFTVLKLTSGDNLRINNAEAVRVLSKEFGSCKLSVSLTPTFIDLENYYEIKKQSI